MQERPCQQLFSGVLEKLSAEVLRAHRHRFGPRDLLAKFRNAQAASVLRCRPSLLTITGLIRTSWQAGLFFESHIDDGDSFRNADLRAGPPDAGAAYMLRQSVSL